MKKRTRYSLLLIGTLTVTFPIYASVTISASQPAGSYMVTFPQGSNSATTPSPSVVFCERTDGGDPNNVTVDFYGAYPCNGQEHTVYQGISWPANLTAYNRETYDVIVNAKLKHSTGTYSTIQVTVPGRKTCSATLENPISLGNLQPGTSKQVPLTSGSSTLSGPVTLKPSSVGTNNTGALTGGDVTYTIPEATWYAGSQQWYASLGSKLTLKASVAQNAAPGSKSGYLTAMITCP